MWNETIWSLRATSRQNSIKQAFVFSACFCSGQTYPPRGGAHLESFTTNSSYQSDLIAYSVNHSRLTYVALQEIETPSSSTGD
jgi:hypothetical protein